MPGSFYLQVDIQPGTGEPRKQGGDLAHHPLLDRISAVLDADLIVHLAPRPA